MTATAAAMASPAPVWNAAMGETFSYSTPKSAVPARTKTPFAR